MTVDTLHDALTLLPADLVAQADARRCRKRGGIHWQRWAAMAACLALMLGGGILFRHSRLLRMDSIGQVTSFAAENAMDQAPGEAFRQESVTQAAAEAPAEDNGYAACGMPPCMTVSSGDGSLSCVSSNYTWAVEEEDGTAGTTAACGAAPTDDPEGLPVLEAAGLTVSLSWEIPPRSVTARCWPESGKEAEQAEVEGDILNLKPGTCIYEVTAHWEQGSASYVFRVRGPREGD